jgi:uncharacterized protein
MTNHSSTTSLIVVQPTPFCNINCSYCYLPRRSDRSKLALDDLRRMFERVLLFPTIGDRVTVVWHAGEPLVLGSDYYEAAFSCIRDLCPSSLTLDHAMQTNGTLLTEKWCEFFKRWDVGLGVSIDGPRHIHDASRKTRSGKGTYDKTVAGIQLLQRSDIPFYVITVLTKAALLDPDGMFAFYNEFGIRDVGFNFEEQEGCHESSSLNSPVHGEMALSFFARFSELMTERAFPIAVREFEEAIASVGFLQDEGPASNQLTPFGIVTIDVNGNVFTFSPELAGYASRDFPTFAIGNIFEHSFDQLKSSAVLKKMTAQIDEGIALCRASCPYFRVCGGGAPSNKVFENGSFATTETMYCRLSKQRVTDFVLSTIESRLGVDPTRPTDRSDRVRPPRPM